MSANSVLALDAHGQAPGLLQDSVMSQDIFLRRRVG